MEEFSSVAATEDATVDQMNDLMNRNGIRHLPILREGRVVGIVSDRDLRVVLGLEEREKQMIRAVDIMKSYVGAVTDALKTLTELLEPKRSYI